LCVAIVLLLVLSGNGNIVSAQQPFFRNVSLDKVMKSGRIAALFQDHKGYLWIGSSLGLCRYDGFTFHFFKGEQTAVTAISENGNGQIWAGYNDGQIRYVVNDSVCSFASMPSVPAVPITGILFDNRKRLWVATYGEGIYCYSDSVTIRFTEMTGLSDNVVNDIVSSNDSVWAGTDRGLSLCYLQADQPRVLIFNQQNGLPDNIVRSITIDRQKRVWMGFQEKGIAMLDRKKDFIFQPAMSEAWEYGQVNDLLTIRDELWIATENDGLLKADFGDSTVSRLPGIDNNGLRNLRQLLYDQQGELWLISDRALQQCNAGKFDFTPIPTQWVDPIKAITADQQNHIFFANGKGIFQKKADAAPIQQLQGLKEIDYATIVSLYADQAERLWIGTYNNGLYIFDLRRERLNHYLIRDGLSDNNVFCISGNWNEVWLGTLGGATKAEISKEKALFTVFNKSQGLNNNYIYSICTDRKGRNWFATDGKGLNVLQNGKFWYLDNVTGLNKQIVYGITEDIYGNIWFSGQGPELFCYNGDSITRFSKTEGLPDKDILNIRADKRGNLIIAYTDGIDIFNIRDHSIFQYGAAAGLADLNPQLNAITENKEGEIYIGGRDRILHIQALTATAAPKVQLTDVQLFFRSLPDSHPHIFNYDENQLSFDFTTLGLQDPEMLNYEYKLEGFHEEWIRTGDHYITLTNLPPGNYRLRLRASQTDYFSGGSIVYTFTIRQAFWRTLWFRLLLGLIVASLAYYFIRIRMKIIRLEQEKQREAYAAQLLFLKNQLNPHFLFNILNTLLNIIDINKVQALEFTERLSGFYREMLVLQDKNLVTVREELRLLNNYIFLQQKRFGKRLVTKFDIHEEDLELFLPALTLQLLTENALKHNKSTELSPIVVSYESTQQHLIVSNNINRMETDAPSAGMGLRNIRQRVHLLTGQEMKLISDEDNFIVIIPLVKEPK